MYNATTETLLRREVSINPAATKTPDTIRAIL